MTDNLPATRDQKLDATIEQYAPTFQNGELIIQGAHILGGKFKNFSGEERQFNPEGVRSFHVRLDEQTAQQLISDGWNVKFKEPRTEEEEGFYHVNVVVGFKSKRPPLLVLISSKGRVDLGQHECEILDWVDMEHVDLIINPYHWKIEATGKSGIKAYLKAIYVTLREDYLTQKYADVPYANATADQITASIGPLEIEAGDIGDAEIMDAEVVYDSEEEA